LANIINFNRQPILGRDISVILLIF
jgi:hypothetical protein